MITQWSVPVAGVEPGYLEAPHVHALVTSWLGHDNTNPWCITGTTAEDGVLTIDLVTLTYEGGCRLGEQPLALRGIRLGAQHGVLLSDAIPRAVHSYDDLFQSTVNSADRIAFQTPTTIKNQHRTSPFLEPARIARSTARRWNNIVDDPALRLDENDATGVWVSDIDGRTEVVQLHGNTVSGFVGEMRFAYSTPESATLFSRIWAFAELAGVGAQTATGFGRITRLREDAAREPGRPRRASARRPRQTPAG